MSLLERLLSLLAALGEDEQRVHVLSEYVESESPAEIVAALGQSMQRIADGDPRPRLLIDVFHSAVDHDAFHYSKAAELYEAAAEQDATDVQRMLLAPPPQEIETVRREPAGTLASSGQTLGMRKWLARRAPADTIDRLLGDPDPDVIENLLKNPRLTEAEVLRIVARRPNYPDVIAAVCRSPRWNRRYGLRRAVVLNPFTPVDLALRQVPFLNRADLFSVARDGKLHEEIRERAAALAQKRPPRKDEAGEDDESA